MKTVTRRSGAPQKSRPSGGHGGNRAGHRRRLAAQPRQSSQAAGKDPARHKGR